MVDKRYELMALVFRLAGAEEYSHTGTSHQKMIAQTFDKFSNHPAVEYAKHLRKTYGISFDAVFSFAVHIRQKGDGFIFADDIDSLENRWIRDAAEAFLPLLSDFYKDTDYETFYKSNTAFYEAETERFVQEVLSGLNLEWFVQYGLEPANLHCIITPSFNEFNYAAIMNRGVVYVLLSVFSQHTLIHEYIHGFTKPIADDWYTNDLNFKQWCDETAANPHLWYIGNMPWEYVTHAYTILYFADHGANPIPLLFTDYAKGCRYIQEVYAMITNHVKVDFIAWLGIDWKNAERIGQEHTYTMHDGSVIKWQYLNVPDLSIEGLMGSECGNVFGSQTGDVFIVTSQNEVKIDLGPTTFQGKSGFRSYSSISLC